MISDLSSQWPILVLIGTLAAVVIALLSCWLSRSLATALAVMADAVSVVTEKILSQDERIREMANQVAENEDKRVETERKLARLQERHAALKERVDTGFDILQRRLDSNIERFRADTSSTITEVRLILKDPPEDDAESPEALTDESDSDPNGS